MKQQVYKNHYRFVTLYHFVALPLAAAVVIANVMHVTKATSQNVYSASLGLATSIVLALVVVFCRTFALKAQDRAIRAEENIRHFILTGKPLDPRLRMDQIIAVRFASDEEFPALCQEAAGKNLKATAIKKAIQSWRPDYYRA